ncbi:MAG TPA: hypothetical protein VLF60_02425 [Candidatus Saccharimonadales bacterium]|nr:hypothetical protein [Candidatus Saccharimonadales bacterium]
MKKDIRKLFLITLATTSCLLVFLITLTPLQHPVNACKDAVGHFRSYGYCTFSSPFIFLASNVIAHAAGAGLLRYYRFRHNGLIATLSALCTLVAFYAIRIIPDVRIQIVAYSGAISLFYTVGLAVFKGRSETTPTQL